MTACKSYTDAQSLAFEVANLDSTVATPEPLRRLEGYICACMTALGCIQAYLADIKVNSDELPGIRGKLDDIHETLEQIERNTEDD